MKGTLWQKYFLYLTSTINRNGGGGQAEESGLCFLSALINVLVSLCVQIQRDPNPLISQAGTISALPQGAAIITWHLHLLTLTEKQTQSQQEEDYFFHHLARIMSMSNMKGSLSCA